MSLLYSFQGRDYFTKQILPCQLGHLLRKHKQPENRSATSQHIAVSRLQYILCSIKRRKKASQECIGNTLHLRDLGSHSEGKSSIFILLATH